MNDDYEEGVYLPYGKIECIYKDYISDKLNCIESNEAFILLRDIICCVYNYTLNFNDIDKTIKLFNLYNDLITTDIHKTLVKNKDIKWKEIFNKSCDYDKTLNHFGYYKYNIDIVDACPHSIDGGLSPEAILFANNMLFLSHGVDSEEYDTIVEIFKSGQLIPSQRKEQYP